MTEPATPARSTIVKVVAASMAGTTVEWYDFFLYGVAAALVFPKVFFPGSDPAVGVLLALGTFAIGFIARPIGGLIFGHYGDILGRKKLLVISLLMMGTATFLIGLLPGYATIGVAAPILLVLLRLVQGFGLGGEWGGAVLIVSEYGDPARRGYWASWPQAGVPLGQLLANGLLALLALVQSEEAFLSWGWRIPFLLSAVLVLIGLFIRLSIEESPVFRAAQAKTQAATESGEKQADADPGGVPQVSARGLHRDGRAVRRERLVLHLHGCGRHLPDQEPAGPHRLELVRAECRADRRGRAFRDDPDLGRVVGQIRPEADLSVRRGRRRRLGVRVHLPGRHRKLHADGGGGGRRTAVPRRDVRAAGGVPVRIVRHQGAVLRECPSATSWPRSSPAGWRR